MNATVPHTGVRPVVLQEPSPAGFLLVAATVDRRPPFLPNSRRKRALLAGIAEDLRRLTESDQTTEVNLFDAVLVAPGMGHRLLRKRSGSVQPAHFDVVLLIQTADPASALSLRSDPVYRCVRDRLEQSSSRIYEVAARNSARIADVDHARDSVFLFNFFYADDTARLMSVWEYSAGWFVQKAHLPDSTVLEPLAGEPVEYGIVNHASWPGFRTFLPHLLLRPSFRRFVLANFEANNVAAQPILYRRQL
ncbi:hypothetical protein [Mycolicibacterium mengxianglii]|uniref:hypothetical protein n=1 Tax=Mycolicibacterium mengxianglii TaxID=2736649 RepID=UPI0018D1D480|nr:hypothetical protein [Mycolicibacterium mengxianglii]